jgi:hypothetical protein
MSGPDYSKAVVMGAAPATSGRPIVLRDSYAGGIGDKNEQETGQLGNQAILVVPAAVTDFSAGGTVSNSLWPKPPNFPGPNTTLTPILQGRSFVTKNPRSLLISIDAPVLINNVNDADIDVKALIAYGVGGDNNSVIVDAYNGTQITLEATNVEVDGLYTTLNVGAAAPQLRLGAALGYGVRAGESFGPSFTNRFFIKAGETTPMVVPAYARDFTIIQEDNMTGLPLAAATTTVFFQSLTGSVEFGAFLYPIASIPIIPLPNGANRIVLKNGNANPIVGAVRFGLAL